MSIKRSPAAYSNTNRKRRISLIPNPDQSLNASLITRQFHRLPVIQDPQGRRIITRRSWQTRFLSLSLDEIATFPARKPRRTPRNREGEREEMRKGTLVRESSVGSFKLSLTRQRFFFSRSLSTSEIADSITREWHSSPRFVRLKNTAEVLVIVAARDRQHVSSCWITRDNGSGSLECLFLANRGGVLGEIEIATWLGGKPSPSGHPRLILLPTRGRRSCLCCGGDGWDSWMRMRRRMRGRRSRGPLYIARIDPRCDRLSFRISHRASVLIEMRYSHKWGCYLLVRVFLQLIQVIPM